MILITSGMTCYQIRHDACSCPRVYVPATEGANGGFIGGASLTITGLA